MSYDPAYHANRSEYQKARDRERNRLWRRKRRAELSDEFQAEQRRAWDAKYRDANRERRREYDREYHRRMSEAKVLANVKRRA